MAVLYLMSLKLHTMWPECTLTAAFRAIGPFGRQDCVGSK